MDNPAGITDVTDGFERPLTSYEEKAAKKWLDEAWVILQLEIPGIGSRTNLADTAPGYLTVEAIVTVLAAMVRRVLRNPGGRRSWGEDTYQETIDTALSSGELYVSDIERARLAPAAVSGGMYSIGLSR